MIRSACSLVLTAIALFASAGAYAGVVGLGNALPAEAGGALLAIAVAGVIAGIYVKRRKR